MLEIYWLSTPLLTVKKESKYSSETLVFSGEPYSNTLMCKIWWASPFIGEWQLKNEWSKREEVVVESDGVPPLVQHVGQVPYGNGAVIGGLANV